MSKLYKCDRCKKTFADEVDEKTFIQPSKVLFGDMDIPRKSLYRADLCQKCANEHTKWLFGVSEEKKGN